MLLPCAAADVAVLLPPSLALAATPHGHLDCRLQLLGFVADWPPARPASSTPGAVPRVLPARSAAGGYAVRTGALLAAHVLFPDHTRGLLGALSLPLAIADGAAAAAAVVPPRARAAIARRGAAAKARMQGDTVQHGRLGWLDAAAGCAAGGLHALRSASGPAAALATGGWLWALAHPHSAALCRCMIALLAVSADYERLGRDSAAGRLGTGVMSSCAGLTVCAPAAALTEQQQQQQHTHTHTPLPHCLQASTWMLRGMRATRQLRAAWRAFATICQPDHHLHPLLALHGAAALRLVWQLEARRFWARQQLRGAWMAR